MYVFLLLASLNSCITVNVRSLSDVLQQKRYTDQWVSIAKTWNLATLEWALEEHLEGQFYASGMLMDALPTYDAYSVGMETLINSVKNLQWYFEPASMAYQDQLIAQGANRNIGRLLPGFMLSDWVRDGFVIGQCIGRVNWKLIDGYGYPDFERWHPSHTYYMQSHRIYRAQSTDGTKDVSEEDGWAIHAPFGYHRGWVQAKCRAIATPFIMSLFTFRDWGRFCEVHGLPTTLAKVPSKASDADKRRWRADIQRRSSEAVVTAPQGPTAAESFGMEIVHPDGATSWQAFQAFRSELKTSTTITLLGQNLTTEVQSGSLAAAQIHNLVRNDYTDARGSEVCETWNRVIGPQWAEYNFRRRAPKLTFKRLSNVGLPVTTNDIEVQNESR